MKEKSNKNIFMWVMLVLVIVLVLLFPKIHDFIEESRLPKSNEPEKEEEVEEKVIDEDVLETIHYPKMRTSKYNADTYYSLDEFTVNDLSNSDILLNAFLGIEDITIKDYDKWVSCTDQPKQLQKDFIELRVKNLLSKNLNYTLEDFYVPEDIGSKYAGDWTFDAADNMFIYKGLCSSKATDTEYYDLEQLINIDYEGNDIVAKYYVGFAKVSGNNYAIYSDAAMENEMISGVITDASELNSIFESIKDEDKKIYKYTFKDSLCTYNEYCLYKGEWVNEL